MSSGSTFLLQSFGGDLVSKTSLNPNFCLEATTSSAGTPIDVSQCATREIQLWTFLQSSDNSIVIADGGGQWLGYKKMFALGTVLGRCSFHNGEHFLLSGGQITNRAGTECLTYAKPTPNAGVF